MPKQERRVEVAKTEIAELYTEIRRYLKDQERRVFQLVGRDAACGSGGRDGHSRGGGGPGQKNGITDSAGNAAMANVEPDLDPTGEKRRHHIETDLVHRSAVAVLKAARDARDQLEIIDGHLEARDRSTADAKPPDPCECCAAADRSAPMQIYSTVAGRLPRFYSLCGWHYERVRKTGQLPTIEAVRRHHGG